MFNKGEEGIPKQGPLCALAQDIERRRARLQTAWMPNPQGSAWHGHTRPGEFFGPWRLARDLRRDAEAGRSRFSEISYVSPTPDPDDKLVGNVSLVARARRMTSAAPSALTIAGGMRASAAPGERAHGAVAAEQRHDGSHLRPAIVRTQSRRRRAVGVERSKGKHAMSYKAIYAYPWDVAEIGVSAAVDRFLALGLDTVTITGSYHAGKFLRPHGKGGKVYFPEDGTIYFKPDLSRYGAIKPVENSLLSSGQDIVRELVGKAAWRPMSGSCSCTTRGSACCIPSPSSPTPLAIATSTISAPRRPRRAPTRSASPATSPNPIRLVACPWRRRASFLTRMATTMSSRSIGPIAGSTASSAFVSARIAGRARRAPGFASKRSSGRSEPTSKPISQATSIFPPTWRKPSGLRTSAATATSRAYLDWRCSVVTSLVREIRDAVRKDATVAVIPSVARPTGGRLV